MKSVIYKSLSLLILCLCLASQSMAADESDIEIEFAIAQKLMLDLRYYCPEPHPKKYCNQPLTHLPDELKTMIQESGLGGIILFADNLVNPEQITQLTTDLRKASANNKYHKPLLISVDQEGGRVVRLPMQYATSFSGNMAIGATYKKHNTKFASATGEVIGRELNALGFNVNHAPNADVNVNPNNPVINVRSFSEDPKIVAELANAQLQAMQQQGIIGTLKHFPGHGDTNVDSHTGLPRVNHNLATISQVDLAPFQYAIDRGNAKMIMTAHIQYPALDDTTLVNKKGESMLKPATMSRKILTGLLREKMGFEGVIITDALDMKGISDFFNETDAVLQTFKAGADIALMPIKIRTKSDITKLSELITQLSQKVVAGELPKQQVLASYDRIQNLKKGYMDTHFKNHSSNNRKKNSRDTHSNLATTEHKEVEQALANASLTAVKGTGVLTSNNVHFLMPDPNKCRAILQALKQYKPSLTTSCSDYLSHSYQEVKQRAKDSNSIVIGKITPTQSLAEIGGMDDLSTSLKLSRSAKWPKAMRIKQTRWLMAQAQRDNKQVIFVAMRAPYQAADFAPLADDVIATYSYTHTTHNDEKFEGPVYNALAQLFSGKINATGETPVSLKLK